MPPTWQWAATADRVATAASCSASAAMAATGASEPLQASAHPAGSGLICCSALTGRRG
ncbi:hypothetical protein [Mycobacterium sp. TY815]|uniref:hypothetical protein n=1 Tax=Mycobacterium sp. TY815 TaxID=3050581 RepID=UPI003531F1B4